MVFSQSIWGNNLKFVNCRNPLFITPFILPPILLHLAARGGHTSHTSPPSCAPEHSDTKLKQQQLNINKALHGFLLPGMWYCTAVCVVTDISKKRVLFPRVWGLWFFMDLISIPKMSTVTESIHVHQSKCFWKKYDAACPFWREGSSSDSMYN